MHSHRLPASPFAGALLAGLVASCSGSECSNQAFFGLPSPDSASIAFVFHRRCTGTPTVTTEVSVMDFHDSLHNDPGNVLTVGTEQPVHVAWLGPKKLLVTGFAEPIVKRTAQIGAIGIEFRSSGKGSAD